MPKPVQKRKPVQNKSTKKRPSSDPNRRAHQLLQEHMDRAGETIAPPPGDPLKAVISAYMSKLGTAGGKKSGLARMSKMTKTDRSEVARKAAEARWKAKGK